MFTVPAALWSKIVVVALWEEYQSWLRAVAHVRP